MNATKNTKIDVERIKTKEWRKVFKRLFGWMWEIQSNLVVNENENNVEYYAFHDIQIVSELTMKMVTRFLVCHLDELPSDQVEILIVCQYVLSAAMYLVLAIVSDADVHWSDLLAYMCKKKLSNGSVPAARNSGYSRTAVKKCNVIVQKVLMDLNYIPVPLEILHRYQKKYHLMDFDSYYDEMKNTYQYFWIVSQKKDAVEIFKDLFPKKKCKSIFLEEL